MIIPVLIVLASVTIISIVVFGGGQIFIPYFRILLVNFLKISNEDWDSVLSISNATPGVFGLKMALISGYFASTNHWQGFLIMFFSYLIFILIPIAIILVVMKKYQKVKENEIMKVFLKLMRPMIAGILISVALNLLISLLFPFINFNDLNNYLNFNDESFFIKWRLVVLIIWSIISIIADFVIIKKWGTNPIYLILINIIICLLLFQPWI